MCTAADAWKAVIETCISWLERQLANCQGSCTGSNENRITVRAAFRRISVSTVKKPLLNDLSNENRITASGRYAGGGCPLGTLTEAPNVTVNDNDVGDDPGLRGYGGYVNRLWHPRYMGLRQHKEQSTFEPTYKSRKCLCL